MCNEVQNVGAIDFAKRGSKMKISTAFGMPLNESPCVGCGQCSAVCPTGALVVRNDTAKVWRALEDENLKVSVQIAPAVRVAIGRELHVQDGENAMGKIVAALRRIGFDEIYDTSAGADLTVLEESEELLDRLERAKNCRFSPPLPGMGELLRKEASGAAPQRFKLPLPDADVRGSA